MAGNYDEKEADIEDIFDQTFEYTRTGEFLYVFEDYIREHADAFDVEGDEHRLEWTEIFNDYLKIFEDIMVDFIKAKGATIYQFYEACEKKKDVGSGQEKHFIELLTASAAYKDFQEIMCREAKFRMFQTKHIKEGRIDPETLKRVDNDDKGGYRVPEGGIGGGGAAAKSFNHK